MTTLITKMLGGQWLKDVAKAFEENEKKVTGILEQIKATTLSEADVANSLARIMKAFEHKKPHGITLYSS